MGGKGSPERLRGPGHGFCLSCTGKGLFFKQLDFKAEKGISTRPKRTSHRCFLASASSLCAVYASDTAGSSECSFHECSSPAEALVLD